MSSFDAYAGEGDELGHARPFGNEGYSSFDSGLPSERFDTFRMPDEGSDEDHFTQEDSKDLGYLDEEDDFGTRKERTSSNGPFDAMGDTPSPPPVYHSGFDDELADVQSPSISSPNFGQSFESRLQPDFVPADEFSESFDSDSKALGHDSSFSHSEGFGYGFPPPADFHDSGAVLLPPDEMQAEEGFILREWKRKNAIYLEEKARNEREELSHIINAADDYKAAFSEKWKTHCEATKKNNRDKEKVFLESHKDFHANADKHYWKAVAELIPHELPAMEVKSRGKKDQKKPAVVINHGPKPGKATDLTRMRQVLVKLKHNPPAHMKAPPPAPPAAASAQAADGKSNVESGDGKAAAAAPASASAPAPPPLQKQGSFPTAAVA